MSSSDGFASENAHQSRELNAEQINALLQKLSSDEQKELTEMMRTCTTEVTMTRGLPITGAVLGSLWFARQRLPAQYHFGPKGWPFYAIMGVASLTATNLMFMKTCGDRVKPHINQLWKKYDMAGSRTNYDEIRRQNRGGAPNFQQNAPISDTQRQEKTSPNAYDYTYSIPSSTESSDSFTSYKPLIGETSEFERAPRARRPPPPPPSFSPSDEGFMSGTPSFSSSGAPGAPPPADQGYTFS